LIRRRLGQGPSVSAMCLGALHFGVFQDAAESRRRIDTAIDMGINFIETAPMYGAGNSERFVGAAIAGKRDKVVISTKVGLVPDVRVDGAFAVKNVPLTRKNVAQSVDASLAALGIETIDLLQLHAFDAGTPIEETVAALAQLRDAGKIVYVGVSNHDADEYATVKTAMRDAGLPFVSFQCHFNMIERRAEEALIRPCHRDGIGVLCNRGLARGILGGRYRPGADLPPDSRAASSPRIRALLSDDILDLVQRLSAVAAGEGLSIAQLAVRWLLSREGIISVAVGARTHEQLVDLVRAAQDRLSPETLEQIDAAIADFGHADAVARAPAMFFEK